MTCMHVSQRAVKLSNPATSVATPKSNMVSGLRACPPHIARRQSEDPPLHKGMILSCIRNTTNR